MVPRAVNQERLCPILHSVETSVLPPWDLQQPPPLPVRRFTVEEYRRLGESGILSEDDRVELLEGWIVPKMVHNPPHDNAVELAADTLRVRIPAGWSVRVQSSIRTADSEPEPDLAVVRGSARSRSGRHPTPEEIALVVEVADASLDRDRRSKARVYARAGIAVYWIVNLVDRQVESHEDPSGPAPEPHYGRRAVHRPGELLALRVAESIASFDPAELLP